MTTTEHERIQVSTALPEARTLLVRLNNTVEKAAADAGVDQALIHLVKIRVSQINGCAYCTDAHSGEARAAGESERRIFVLPVWRETGLFTEQERAALELAEATARLSEHQDVPDAVYRQATGAFTERQYVVLVWAATMINAFNRLGVTSRKPLAE